MKPLWKNRIGQRFGRLVLEEFTEFGKNTRTKCRCDCGATAYPLWGNVKSGRTKSCGCLEDESRITHGRNGSPEHNSWENMWNRCKGGTVQSRSSPGYLKVGVCPEWKSFEAFFRDMGPRPTGTTLDRIDNSKGYSKENCRWATHKQQQRNRDANRLFTLDGKTACLSEWAESLGIKPHTLLNRLGRGWPVRKALTTPKVH